MNKFLRSAIQLSVIIALTFIASPARAQYANARGWCEDGAQIVTTSGLPSTTTVQASFPQCTVSVSIHGGGPATIYSDNSGTPLSNPFTADTNGQWIFYVADGRYDITMSGASFPSPITYSEVVVISSGGGGGGGGNYQTIESNSTPQTPQPILNLISGTNTTVTCVNNAGNTRTDCTFSSTGSGAGTISPGTIGNLPSYSASTTLGDSGIATSNLPLKSADNAYTSNNRFGGAIPYRDFTATMPPGGCSFPGITSLGATGTIAASSSQLTVSSIADWKNGCGITIPNAGPASTIVMPSCPTITTAARASNVVTITCATQTNLVYTGTGGANGEDQGVTMAGCSDSAMNGTFVLQSNNPGGTQFTYNSAGSNATATGCSAIFYLGWTHGATGSTTVYYKIAPVDTQGGVGAAVGPITITNAPGTAGTGTATDSFGRAGPGLGANWTTVGIFTAPTITSNKVQGNTATTHQASAYTGTSFTGNLTSTITFGGTSTATDTGAAVSALLTDGSGHGYLCQAYDGHIELAAYSGPLVFTVLGSQVTDFLITNDTLSIAQSGNGTTFSCQHNGTPIITSSDSNYAITAPGLDVYGNTSNSVITNFTASGNTSLNLSVQNNNMNFVALFWPYTVGSRMTAIYRSSDNITYTCTGMAFALSYQDWGFTGPCPAFVPITPPAAPTTQNLTTMIASGAGTTTLLLAAPATTAVTSGVVFHDEMSFLDTCVNNANLDQLNVNGYSPGSVGCVIPAGVYHFNSDFTTDRIAPSYGGMQIQVAGTPYLESWPWIIGQANYSLVGLGSSGAQQNASNWQSTSVLATTSVPAAFIIHASSIVLDRFSALGLQGCGIYAGLSPSGLGGPSGVQLNHILISNRSTSACIPLMIGGNEFEIQSNFMNLYPRPDGMPCSILFTTDTYEGIGGADNTFNNLDFEWHQFCSNAPGGQQGQGFSWNVNTNWNEEHGQYPTGGYVTVDTGDSVHGGSTINSIGVTGMQNADASNKTFFSVIGTNAATTIASIAADAFSPLIGCFNALSTACSTGSVNVTMLNTSSENPYNGKTQVGPFASYSKYIIGFPLTLTSGQGMWGNTPPSPFIADALPAASNTTVTANGTGGSLAAGTYCMKVVGLDFQATPGTTLPGPSVCQTVAGSGDISLQWQLPTFNGWMYSDWRVYNNFNGGAYDHYADTSLGPQSSFTYTYDLTSRGTAANIPTDPTAYMTWLDRDIGYGGCIYCDGTSGSPRPLGIGQPSPTERLDILGNINVSGTMKWKAGTAFQAILTHADTAARTYTFIDQTGVVGNFATVAGWVAGNCVKGGTVPGSFVQDSSTCGGGSGGANTSLSNISGVAASASLIPGAVNSYALGSAALPWTQLYLGTVANQALSINTSSLTTNRSVKAPDSASLVIPIGGACSTSNWFNALSATTGIFTCAQPAFTDVTGTSLYTQGGTGQTTAPNHDVLVGTGSAWGLQTVPDCQDSAGNHINFTQSSNTFTCGNTSAAGTVTASSTTTFTNKTLDQEGTGNVLTTVATGWFRAAGCNNSTAAPSFDLPATQAPAPNCLTGTNVQKATLDYDDSVNEFAQFDLGLPHTWVGNVDINLRWLVTAGGGSNAVKWTVATACSADGSSYDTSFNSPQTITTNVGANGVQTTSSQTTITVTGCAADNIINFKIGRDTTDTFTGTARLIAAQVIYRHTGK